MQQDKIDPEQIKPDLKHDSMEYAASTDGDDILDSDTRDDEDEEITADELAFLEGDDLENQAEALKSVEIDRALDDDLNFDLADSDADEGELAREDNGDDSDDEPEMP